MIDSIFTLFERFGGEHYGENASQLQHALQCAQLAREHGCEDGLVAASLLHDIGQFLNGAGDAAASQQRDARHEIIGAAFLSRGFDRDVTEPVRLHVDAKRYLCTIEAGYEASLSDASLLSLRLQGGKMTLAELKAFATEPFGRQAVLLRRFDDAGKRPDWVVPGLETYRDMLGSLLRPDHAAG